MAGHHEFDGLQEDVHVVADVGVDVGLLPDGLAVVTPSVYSGSAWSLQAWTTAWISSSVM